jgi:hypothetical protein
MADSIRGIHVSPGVYTKETDLNYAVKSLGVTTLGLIGETQKGPAFEPIDIANWREFQQVFGGTSTEKFKGSQFPKFELPYIAKSYLTESEQLKVVRILGFSGYNAGPAWLITGSKDGKNRQIIAVLRSRGTYKSFVNNFTSADSCECYRGYDNIQYYVGEQGSIIGEAGNCDKPRHFNMDALKLDNYTPVDGNKIYCDTYQLTSGTTDEISVNSLNMGRFKIIGISGSTAVGTEVKNDAQESDSGATGATLVSRNFAIPVSLNPGDNDYILKVLGTDPQDGDTPVYVESLYDVAWAQAITNAEVDKLDLKLERYNVYFPADYGGFVPVTGLLRKTEEELRRKDIGKRYLADALSGEKSSAHTDNLGILVHEYNYTTNKPVVVDNPIKVLREHPELSVNTGDSASVISAKTAQIESIIAEKNFAKPVNPIVGQIYTVSQYTDSTGKRHYYYKYYAEGVTTAVTSGSEFMEVADKLVSYSASNAAFSASTHGAQVKVGDYSSYYLQGKGVVVYNYEDGLYYKLNSLKDDVVNISCDLNNYKSQFRYSSTPWILSNVKGDRTHINLNKMFRFHTISDGDASVDEIKISIENIRPDAGTFDVCVRDINDTDGSPVFLEKFGKCNMVPGDVNYVGYKIGTFDGQYESKSNYITIEIADTTAAKNSVPAGFMGYPKPNYEGATIGDEDTHKDVTMPKIQYNTSYDEEIKNRKQYFGLSNLTGIDIDYFTFKGNLAYIDLPEFTTSGFHLDCRVNEESYLNAGVTFTVDGISGYNFETVSVSDRTQTLQETPIIDTEDQMAGSIFENVNLRKFTVYFYGGFDGFDIYRDQRSNGDNFRYSTYKGVISSKSGEGYAFNSFSLLNDGGSYGITGNAITSDYYAYLAGIRQFANPATVDINLIATPGIDIENNTQLVKETVEMAEEERADTFYIPTMPDKPNGASDSYEDMYTPDDVVGILEDAEIDSSYAATYYPWVKYQDNDNNQYIYLPATKDAVRNMAYGDNQNSTAGLAPAGMSSRGNVVAVRAHKRTTLSEEDTLYGNNINPIKTFSQDGLRVWGQKTLNYSTDATDTEDNAPLSRIDVRRSLLQLRKQLSQASLHMLFEPNDAQCKKEFETLATPILESFKTNRSLKKFKLEISQSEEERERHEMSAVIYLLFVGALEYINLNFVIARNELTFEQI